MEREEKGKDENEQLFTTKSFYGRAQPQEQLVRVARTRKRIRERPLISDYRPGILGPPATWKTFRRQADAIKFAHMQGNGLMVFSFEGDAVGDSGKRNFVVAHPKRMWNHQCERKPQQRCTYEVIQENSVCKLYFDLEFMHMLNPKSDGVKMTKTFIKIVCYFLQKEFNVHCTREHIIDLASSSFAKFSRHLIFNIPDAAFANNIHVGNFVINLCNQIRSWATKGMEETLDFSFSDVEQLFVADSKGNKVLFCDEGVYTKNRNFRILHSTKYGKNTPLLIAPENQYIPSKRSGESSKEQFFLDSLITTVQETSRILTFGDDGEKRERLKQKEKESSGPGMEGFSHSPYPEIDNYIQSILGHGSIRCWFYFPQSELLVYEIVNNRFCHNIGREHKSNGIMYVANLKLAVYYQKCHDSECQDFRSDPQPLPEWTVFWKSMDDEAMMEWIEDPQNRENGNEKDDDDSLLVLAASQVEREDLSDNEMTDAVHKFEMWDNIDLVSLSSASRQSSQQSSQKSNPWDKLSLISSPGSSFYDESSQQSQNDSKFNSLQDIENRPKQTTGTYDFDSDEEFVSAAAIVEAEVQNQTGDEIEFSSCGLDDDDFMEL